MFSNDEKEICHQAIITCWSCRRLFPVNVMLEGEALIIDPGGATFTPDGWVCSACSDPDREVFSTHKERLQEIVDALRPIAAGMTRGEIADDLGLTPEAISGYLRELVDLKVLIKVYDPAGRHVTRYRMAYYS